jgi:hypothetical protein
MESKTRHLSQILHKTQTNWEESLYIYLARYMGARVNKDPFESLVNGLPYLLIQKNRNDLQSIEALLFGQAGMLDADFEDEYFQKLKQEYKFLANKYQLKSMSPVAWKFSRMRPVGFPTIRIAQFAQILYKTDRLFSQLILAKDTLEIKQMFKVKPSSYWNHHYRFGKDANYLEKNLGEGFIEQLIINVVCPTLFLYGKHIGEQRYCDKAIHHLEETKAEANKIIRKFKSIGFNCKSASETQALIQLKESYCNEKQCVSCAIGNSIINQKD